MQISHTHICIHAYTHARMHTNLHSSIPTQTFPDEAHKHMSVATHSISFWMWVGMVNAAGRTFYNELYDPSTYPWYVPLISNAALTILFFSIKLFNWKCNSAYLILEIRFFDIKQ